MNDYRIIRFSNGDSIFCVVEHEDNESITVAFPMLIKEHTFVIGPNAVRETFSGSLFCPFTDDKLFTLPKAELTYIKPMNNDAIPYYMTLLNKNESVEVLQKYDMHEILNCREEEEKETIDDIREKMKQVAERLGIIDDEENDTHVVRGNDTIH